MRLIQGDCLEVMEQLSDEGVRVDMILTDPPYGTTACKWDTIIPFNEMWDCLSKLTNPNTPILLFGSEPFSSHLRMSNIKNYRYDWIWNKKRGNNFASIKYVPFFSTENISVFYKKFRTFNPQMMKGTPYKHVSGKTGDSYSIKGEGHLTINHGDRHPLNLLSFRKEQKSLHPNQKPIKLLEYLIKTYTNPGDLVLDFTMGSGSTGVACYNTGRDFIGIELDEEYFKVASDRIKKARGQSKLTSFNDKLKVKV